MLAARRPALAAESDAPLLANRFLLMTPLERGFWFFRVEEGLKLVRRIARKHRELVWLEEMGWSSAGRPLLAVRFGRGPQRLAILSGMHGCEPSGPRGCLALADALLSGRGPDGADLRPLRQAILEKQTVCLVPLMNPDAAARFARHFPDCWHGTWYKTWEEAKELFLAEGNEPQGHFTGSNWKKPPMYFTPAQVAEWTAGGHELGSSLTAAGVDIWFDWESFRAVETHAVRDLLDRFRPHAVVDIHNFMFPTEVFAPTVYSSAARAERETALALAMEAALDRARLPRARNRPRPYPKDALPIYEDHYFHHRLGACTLIAEVNGGLLATEGKEYQKELEGQRPLSRAESIESTYRMLLALLEEGNASAYS